MLRECLVSVLQFQTASNVVSGGRPSVCVLAHLRWVSMNTSPVGASSPVEAVSPFSRLLSSQISQYLRVRSPFQITAPLHTLS